MTISDLKANKLILFECITGSRAYGLEHAGSDTDIKGVFICPKERFFGLDYVAQVNNETNDEMYYELGKFVELLLKNNPSMIELLHTPTDKILLEHPLFTHLKSINFLSKKCKDTFAGYAMTQIHKASGLNKKIRNPYPKEKKTILEFCYVLHGQGAMPLFDWLEKHEMQQAQCGLVNINHIRDVYGLYYDVKEVFCYKGIMRKENATTVLLSSIPKGEKPVTHLYFNQDGYKTYCKDYRDYWSWVAHRNEARYENTLQHGKNYDAKNMMHTFRLLSMAKEILAEQKVIVKRHDRAELLRIKTGEFSYADLMEKANNLLQEVEAAWEHSTLPEVANKEAIIEVLTRIRSEFY